MQAMRATREELYVSLDRTLEPSVVDRLESLMDRRLSREPMAYILGRKEFYGLMFGVSPDVLIPRPETEHLVEAALEVLNNKAVASRPVILDIGTGSGAIAISVALHSPKSLVIASDISSAAIKIAEANRRRYPSLDNLQFVIGDLSAWCQGPVDVIVANLPYVPTSVVQTLDPEIKFHEPLGALDGGEDGMDFMRQIIDQAVGLLTAKGSLILELDPSQFGPLCAFITETYGSVEFKVVKDLHGLDRTLVVNGLRVR
jgi:release factor glutamine methyltransferase